MSLRSIVTIGHAGEGLNEALASEADAILLTVATDARPVSAMRATAREALHAAHEAGKRGIVAVNHPRTRMLRDDLDALVGPELSAVFVNHAVEPQDVRDTAVLLREFELSRDIEPGAITIFPVIDSARGLLRTADMLQATVRVQGAVFDSDRYALDIGARVEEAGPRLAYARGAIVAAARAFNMLPLVAAGTLELQQLAQYGFAGAVLANSAAVGQANTAFTPGQSARERAERHIARYEAARAEGAWVARDGSEVVDAAAVRKAQQLLD